MATINFSQLPSNRKISFSNLPSNLARQGQAGPFLPPEIAKERGITTPGAIAPAGFGKKEEIVEPGFFERAKEGFLSGAAAAEESRAGTKEALESGEIGTPRALLESGASMVQAGILPFSRAFEEAAVAPILEFAGETFQQSAEAFEESDIGKAFTESARKSGLVPSEETEGASRDVIINNVRQLAEEFDKLDPETKRTFKTAGRTIEALLELTGFKKGSKPIVEVGEQIIERPAKFASEKLRKGAEASLEKVLSPTKEITKKQTKKILPRLRDEIGVLTTREELQEFASEGVQAASDAIKAFEDAGQIKGATDKGLLIGILEDLKPQKIKGVDGKLIDFDPQVTKAISDLQETVKDLPDVIPNKDVLTVRRIFDKKIDRVKGHLKDTKAGTELDIEKKLANALRKELAKSNPDLDRLNKTFSFYSDLDEVVKATTLRKTGQLGGLTKTILATTGASIGQSIGKSVGGVPGQVIGALIGATFTAKLSGVMTSTFWRTLSAKLKNDLAKALIGGDVADAKRIINQMVRETTKQKKK